ncbi:hypothetical protein E2C01_078051 [Portunus trituberculatus]|uniref:Uncharacterized protein n=1 Tax=Portunus trituberculatus TaxID=210409 RepID=A0A5B7ILM8_PORTR|nr:hypothetical protein [Portunus trituberculatus]
MGVLFSHLPASRLSFASHSPLKVLCSQSTPVLLFQCRLLCLLLTGLQKNVKCFSTYVLLRAELTSCSPSSSPLQRTRKGGGLAARHSGCQQEPRAGKMTHWSDTLGAISVMTPALPRTPHDNHPSPSPHALIAPNHKPPRPLTNISSALCRGVMHSKHRASGAV